ncbi:unnamed protein product [Prunus armeniaca]
MPDKFWFHAMAHSAYLINQMPSKVLANQSPYFRLMQKLPDIIYLRVFRIAVYPCLRETNSHKFQPRTATCVYMGYLMGYTGVLCYNCTTHRFFISHHVIHDESVYPFKHPNTLHSNIMSFASPSLSSNLPSTLVISSENLVSHANHPSSSPCHSEFSPAVPSHLVSTDASSSSIQPLAGSFPVSSDQHMPPIDIANFGSSSRLSSSHNIHPMTTKSKSGLCQKKSFEDYQCLTSMHDSTSLDEPSTFRVASFSPAWIKAMKEKIYALTMQGTWCLVPRPANTNIVGSKWIYNIKRNSDGTVSRYKARLVAHGFSQKAGFDYDETLSPVLNVKNTFLHGDLDEEAPRAWNAKFTGYLPSLGFKMSHSDPSLFVKISDSAIIVLLLYVDDIILTGSNSHVIQEVITYLGSVFDLKDLGPLTFFLGLQISYKSNGDLFISQQKYAKDLLVKAGMESCRSCPAPSKPHKFFPQMLVKRILRYIQGTLHYGLTYSSSVPVSLSAYSDADWARDITTRRSTIGFVVFLGSYPISWQSKKQGSVSHSSTEAEYRALANASAEVAWIRQILADLHVFLPELPLLFCDNMSTLALSFNPVFHSRIKHLDVDFHFVREHVQRKDFLVQHIPTDDQVADVLTKRLHSPVFVKHCTNLSLGGGVFTQWLELVRAVRIVRRLVSLAVSFLYCSSALVVWFGSRLIREKGYSGGAVLNVILAVVTGSMSLGQASPCLSAFVAGQAAAFKMFETTSGKPEIDAYDEKGKTLDDIRGDIELREVFFSYPAIPYEQIFDGFSLYIPTGTTAALVGESGSGKSTVISLIERFYDPRAGEVLIDGINLKEFQLKWIRGKIGLVSQEPVLFASSIKENIAYGKDGATLEEIKAAAQLANAAIFIDKLPQGIDTMVGEHGTQLSGGQKQRISIARAILKDPRILLLDKATSAFDAESENIVQEELDRIMVNRTTVIVAHRLSTQEVNKGSERTAEAQNKSEITRESFIQSSQRMKLVRSLSQNSSVGSMRDNNTLQTEPEAPTLALEQPPKISLRCLAVLNKHEIPVLLIGTVAAMTSGVMIPLFGVLMSRVVKTFYEPPLQQKTDSEFWAMMFMTLGLASLLVIPARRYFFSVAGSKLIERIRLMCFERVVHMEVAWFDEAENSSGAIGARLSADTAILRGLVGDALAQMVSSIATAAACLFIRFTACWQLAFIVLALIPLIGVNGYVQAKFMKGFSLWFVVANGGKVGLKSNLDWDVESEVTGDLGFRLMYEEASQVANDAIGSVRTIAAFCAEEKVMDLYRRKCEAPTEAAKRQGLISGIGFGISLFSLFCVYATSFYAGAKLVEAGKTTFSHVFQVFYALTMAALGISQWSSFAVDSSQAKNAAASIFAIIDRKSKIDPSDESGVKLDNVKGEIELRHLPWLEKVGVENPQLSHCSKDFMIQIQQMGLVSEEPVLFNDTIRANIAYGKDGGATEEKIVAASELANAYTMPTASLAA